MSIQALEVGSIALQDLYAPNNRCFGCGPANDRGLRIKSFVMGDELIADFVPEPHHEAFSGSLNGGIIGTLLDCHSNWAAAYHLMKAKGLQKPPSTVTAELHVKLRRPTALTSAVHVKAHVIERQGDKVIVLAKIFSEGKETASCRSVLAAVSEGYPSHHRR